jgi:hypothetical protein
MRYSTEDALRLAALADARRILAVTRPRYTFATALDALLMARLHAHLMGQYTPPLRPLVAALRTRYHVTTPQGATRHAHAC